MTKRKKIVPDFRSHEQEAKFWDTHDIADYQEELKPIKVRFAEHLSGGITVRFDPRTLNLLRTQAKESGIGPTTLIRMWVIEKLRHQSQNLGFGKHI